MRSANAAATSLTAADTPSNDEATPSEATPYPLSTCIVTGNELGSMGEAVAIEHDGQEIKFCCAPCEPAFEAHAETYVAKLEKAVAAAAEEAAGTAK